MTVLGQLKLRHATVVCRLPKLEQWVREEEPFSRSVTSVEHRSMRKRPAGDVNSVAWNELRNNGVPASRDYLWSCKSGRIRDKNVYLTKINFREKSGVKIELLTNSRRLD